MTVLTPGHCRCTDKCCKDKMPDMQFGERKPRRIDVKEFLEANFTNAIKKVTWKADAVNCPDASPLCISHEWVDNGDYFVGANFSEGQAGVMYQVTLMVETCDDHLGKFCFTQYIKDC